MYEASSEARKTKHGATSEWLPGALHRRILTN